MDRRGFVIQSFGIPFAVLFKKKNMNNDFQNSSIRQMPYDYYKENSLHLLMNEKFRHYEEFRMSMLKQEHLIREQRRQNEELQKYREESQKQSVHAARQSAVSIIIALLSLMTSIFSLFI